MLPAGRRTSRSPQPIRKRRIRSRIVTGLVVAVVAATLIVFGFHHFDTKPVSSQHGDASQQSTTKKEDAKASAPPAPQTHTDAALSQIINSWRASHSFTTSVVVTELTGNLRTATYNATSSVVPASTYKIYVAYAILHGIEQGGYTLSTVTSDGNSIQTDLNAMILNSDNDAARTLGFLYGWKNINTLLQSQGTTGTDLYNYIPPSTQPVGDKHTTASDLATILQKLYKGQLLNQTHTQLLLSLMEQQHYRERIPSGVPSGVTVADKPGWLTGNDDPGTIVQNDAAIVYGPKSTYLLVITTTGSTTQPLADLSKLIYTYLET